MSAVESPVKDIAEAPRSEESWTARFEHEPSARTATRCLVGLFVLSVVVRSVLVSLVFAPTVFSDELGYTKLAQSIGETGRMALYNNPGAFLLAAVPAFDLPDLRLRCFPGDGVRPDQDRQRRRDLAGRRPDLQDRALRLAAQVRPPCGRFVASRSTDALHIVHNERERGVSGLFFQLLGAAGSPSQAERARRRNSPGDDRRCDCGTRAAHRPPPGGADGGDPLGSPRSPSRGPASCPPSGRP